MVMKNVASFKRSKTELDNIRVKILEELSVFPGFEECKSLELYKDSGTINKYNRMFISKMSEFERDPKYSRALNNVKNLYEDAKWAQAEYTGVCIGFDPDRD